MGKGFLKNKRAARGKAHRGPCFKDGCTANGGAIHHCVTCEELVKVGKLAEQDAVRVQCCQEHWHAGLAKLKRHALVAHPVNILRVTAAALKGEL